MPSSLHARRPVVALVASSFAPYVGGVEEHVRRVAGELREQGVGIVVWTVDRGEGLGVQEVDGIRVRYLPTPLPSSSARGVAQYSLQALPALSEWVRAARRDQPDLLHVQCFGPNGLYALAMHRLLRIPMVVSSHGETFADDHAIYDESALLRLGFRAALRRASAVTGCSPVVVADLAERFGFEQTVVVPNGVSLRAPDDPPAAHVSRASDVVALGRLEKVKGFDLLLRAFAEARLRSDVHLLIGGTGSQEASLKDLSETLGLGDSVRFLGKLPPEEVDRVLRSAAVAVVPSRREAFGLVVLEAWKAGTPVIATTLGGPAYLVEDGVDGVLVDPEAPGELAAALVRLTGDADLRQWLAERGAVKVRDFTWAAVARSYVQIYRQTFPHGHWQD